MKTAARLRQLLHYDPETGIFTRLTGQWKGHTVGAICCYGYRLIEVDSRKMRAARLAWLYMTGSWPTEHVDHVNGDPADDRWCNLREASRAQNMANMKTRDDNTSGARGVSWNKHSAKWHARVNFEGIRYHVGYFDSFDEAVTARDAKAVEVHGDFARTLERI